MSIAAKNKSENIRIFKNLKISEFQNLSKGPYTRPYKRPKFKLLSGNSRKIPRIFTQPPIIFTSYG